MANKMISMNKLRQIIRHFHKGLSKSQISFHSGMSRNTIKKYIHKYRSLNLTYDQFQEKTDHELSQIFGTFLKAEPSERYKILEKRFAKMEKDLTKKEYNLKDAHEDYLKEHPD